MMRPPNSRVDSSARSIDGTVNASLIGVRSRARGGFEMTIPSAICFGTWTIDSSIPAPVRTAYSPASRSSIVRPSAA
jgi:hypothetical protein